MSQGVFGVENGTSNRSDIYAVRYEERDAYLYVFIKGPAEQLEASLEVFSAIAQECKDRGFKRLLIEEDLGTNLEFVDMYNFASQVPELGFRGIKVAVADLHMEQMPDNLFGETVAQNRGSLVRVFNDVSAAEKWLLSDEMY